LFRRRRRRNKPANGQTGRNTRDVFAACGGKDIAGMEFGVAMRPGVKKPQATVLIAYGENAPEAVG